MFLPAILAALLAVPSADSVRDERTPIPFEPVRVEGATRRDVATAQLPLEPFRAVDGEAGARRTHVPSARGAIALTVRGAGEGATLWVDVDRDGAAGPGETLPFVGPSDAEPFRTLSLKSAGLPLELFVYEDASGLRATAMTLYHHEADVEVEGEVYRVVVIDSDLDGVLSAGDEWAALDARQREFVRLSGLSFVSNLVSEPWFVGERALRMEVSDGVRLTVGPEDRPRHEFLAEREKRRNAPLFELFDASAADFLEQRGVDPSRPKDEDPPRWYHAWDLPEAKALARRTGRPLWVEFTSDGCEWCKRYAWLNHRDAEVTALLRRFTLVKIQRDLDPGQSAEALGLDGVPCNAAFDASGDVQYTAFGWVTPAAHVKRLEEALRETGPR
ncbi:MAG: thioredoxin family protein [Planctomycetota bacterium]